MGRLMSKIVYSLNHVCVSLNADHNKLVLKDISIQIKQGEQIAVIGKSGAGKTTFLETLALANMPVSGQLKVFGDSPWLLSDPLRHKLRSSLFLTPQHPPLPPRQRVITTVLAGCLPQWSLWQALSSLFHPKNSALAYAALQPFAIEEKIFTRVDRLSGGERQRVSLARMLASNANILLVDEPLSALDPALANTVLNVIKQEAKKRNATLICSLHQTELACRTFPRIIGLRDGKLLFDLPTAEVTQDLISLLYQQTPTKDTDVFIGFNEIEPKLPHLDRNLC